ncbi:MAG: V-type ATP synthase subunit E [Candidatus Thorarchaeota archaeon]
MSEEKELKKQFSQLGYYFIEKAQKEIKQLSQKTLFQKAEIKKRFLERSNERSQRLKAHLIETFGQFLNQSLSSTLLKGKEKVLGLKNNLIQELKKSLFSLIENKINKNYSGYINYLLKSIEGIKNNIDETNDIEIRFNSKDYNYFIKNYDKIGKLFKKPVEIDKDQGDFIGGFKISLIGGTISYDYTLNNLIDKVSPFIQIEIAKIIDDSEIKETEKEFEKFINNQRGKVTDYLKYYEQIQF